MLSRPKGKMDLRVKITEVVIQMVAAGTTDPRAFVRALWSRKGDQPGLPVFDQLGVVFCFVSAEGLVPMVDNERARSIDERQLRAMRHYFKTSTYAFSMYWSMLYFFQLSAVRVSTAPGASGLTPALRLPQMSPFKSRDSRFWNFAESPLFTFSRSWAIGLAVDSETDNVSFFQDEPRRIYILNPLSDSITTPIDLGIVR